MSAAGDHLFLLLMFINLFATDFLLESDKNATNVIPGIHSFLPFKSQGNIVPIQSLDTLLSS